MTELVHSVASSVAGTAASSASSAASVGGLTPEARAALHQLADVVVPPPVPWTPQTAGWVALAVLLSLAVVWLLMWAVRRYRANRYRRAALVQLKRIEAHLNAGDSEEARLRAVAALPVLLKRTALAAWPREAVAGLSGAAWVAFLQTHAGRAQGAVQRLQPLLDDAEYRRAGLSALSLDDANVLAQACREWIARHRVPA